MHTLSLSETFDDAVNACVKDLEGDESELWADIALRTAAWYCSRAYSIVYYARLVPKQQRTHFLEAVAGRTHTTLRRLQEGVQVYSAFYKKGEAAIETAQRIINEHGGWSKALKAIAPPKEEPVEAPHQHQFVCKTCKEALQP